MRPECVCDLANIRFINAISCISLDIFDEQLAPPTLSSDPNSMVLVLNLVILPMLSYSLIMYSWIIDSCIYVEVYA